MVVKNSRSDPFNSVAIRLDGFNLNNLDKKPIHIQRSFPRRKKAQRVRLIGSKFIIEVILIVKIFSNFKF